MTADKSADITIADLPSAGQQTAPPTSTSGYNNPIQSDSTEENDHLNKQALQNGTLSLLPLVNTTVIKTADYLAPLNRQQESSLKPTQGPPVSPVRRRNKICLLLGHGPV